MENPSLAQKCLLMYIELSGERSSRKIVDLDLDPLYDGDWLELVCRKKEDEFDRINFCVESVARLRVETWIQALNHALQYENRPTLMASNLCKRCGAPMEKDFEGEVPAAQAVWKCTNVDECGARWKMTLGMKILDLVEDKEEKEEKNDTEEGE